jgi:hypothetical protein
LKRLITRSLTRRINGLFAQVKRRGIKNRCVK